MDTTAILKFIEIRFGLPNLTRRDAVMPDMQEFFDWVNMPWRTPPTPPNASLVRAEPPSGGVSSVHGSSGAVVGGARLEITDTTSSGFVATTAASDGSFAANIQAAPGDILSIVAVDEVGAGGA